MRATVTSRPLRFTRVPHVGPRNTLIDRDRRVREAAAQFLAASMGKPFWRLWVRGESPLLHSTPTHSRWQQWELQLCWNVSCQATA